METCARSRVPQGGSSTTFPGRMLYQQHCFRHLHTPCLPSAHARTGILLRKSLKPRTGPGADTCSLRSCPERAVNKVTSQALLHLSPQRRCLSLPYIKRNSAMSWQTILGYPRRQNGRPIGLSSGPLRRRTGRRESVSARTTRGRSRGLRTSWGTCSGALRSCAGCAGGQCLTARGTPSRCSQALQAVGLAPRRCMKELQGGDVIVRT